MLLYDFYTTILPNKRIVTDMGKSRYVNDLLNLLEAEKCFKKIEDTVLKEYRDNLKVEVRCVACDRRAV